MCVCGMGGGGGGDLAYLIVGHTRNQNEYRPGENI